jgi:hypothetical protein
MNREEEIEKALERFVAEAIYWDRGQGKFPEKERAALLALIAPAPPAPEAITVTLSREEAELAADAVNYQAVLREIDLDFVIDGPAKTELALEHARLLRALAAIDAALAPGAAADAGEDAGE